MSVATGLAVASNYYAQPLLDTIARAFNLSASSAGFIVTAAQLGYAAGLLFLVPLGDMFERRMLIVSMTLLAAGGMLITASSQSLTMMIVGTALTGLFSVVAQILVPLAATLASPEKRGKVVGTIMSGLLLGILLARTVAGLLASLGGWRTVYWVASVLMVVMALALWRGRAQRTCHVSDASDMKMGDYFDWAADLYGLPRPRRIARAQAQSELPPMLLSFMEESRRLETRRMRSELRLVLRYPTVRQGLVVP